MKEPITKHPKFREACLKAANDIRESVQERRHIDDWPSHVSQKVKDDFWADRLAYADELERGEINSFTAWQDINYALTGESVAFLPS